MSFGNVLFAVVTLLWWGGGQRARKPKKRLIIVTLCYFTPRPEQSIFPILIPLLATAIIPLLALIVSTLGLAAATTSLGGGLILPK